MDTTISWGDFSGLTSIAIAAVLGGLVGLERELARKPAGMRTHIFVCAGASLMMLMGQEIVDQYQRSEVSDVFRSDPIRVLQAIVVGISFLGAGTIIHDREEGVEGLTTAANIFVTAGIGVAVAVDRIALAVVLAIAALTILVVIGAIERMVGHWWDRRHDDSEESSPS